MPLRRSPWKRPLLLCLALSGGLLLTGCFEDPADPTGDGFGDGTIVGENGGFPTDPDPNLSGVGSGVEPVETEATPAERVAAKITELEGKYPIEIDGDWTPEALEILEDVLATYEPRPSVLANLNTIRMVDMNDPELGTRRLLGAFHGIGCRAEGVTRQQCWLRPVVETDPLGGSIRILGNTKDRVHGDKMTTHDTIQHEIGHYFSVAIAKDAAWRDEWRDEAVQQESVSKYGDSLFEEHFAELWAKMFTETDKTLGEIEWSDPGAEPKERFISRGITAKLNTIARKVVDSPVRSDILGRR